MYTHITRDQRVALVAFIHEGYSKKRAAEAIGVHRSTVGRELKRNPSVDGYHAIHANNLSVERRKRSKQAYRKIENDKTLEKKIVSLLHPLVSPEVVAHELGITHETIYAWIYRSRPELKKLLPYHGKQRSRYGTRHSQEQGWLRGVRSIDIRPEEIHSWEGDTVKGGTRSQLLTHVERRSLFTVVDLMHSGEAGTVHAKLKARPIFSGSIITYDRGPEFALWKMIERDTHVEIYFAHPYHPWERGKNENTNGRLRRVFPKRFDFSTITQRDIDRTVWMMNHTKRKTLGWRTPCRVFGRCCGSA